MNKISIIIPVYNTEQYIDRCLMSVINQTDRNIEVVIVNDGSTDNSKNIILGYVEKNPEIFFYYEKENGGLADARNYGITKSTGDYVLFLDSDDSIDNRLIEDLRKYIKNDIDIIKYKANIIKNEKITTIDGPIFNEISGQDAFNHMVFDDKMIDSACVYLFKKDLFNKRHFQFPKGTYHEDVGVVPLMLISANKVTSTDIKGYNYIQTDDSITRNDDYEKTLKRMNDTLLHYDNMIEFISKYDFDKKTIENIKIYYTNAVLLKLNTLNKKDRRDYITKIKKRKMIQNIKVRDIRQFLKRVLLTINVNLYLKIAK